MEKALKQAGVEFIEENGGGPGPSPKAATGKSVRARPIGLSVAFGNGASSSARTK